MIQCEPWLSLPKFAIFIVPVQVDRPFQHQIWVWNFFSFFLKSYNDYHDDVISMQISFSNYFDLKKKIVIFFGTLS